MNKNYEALNDFYDLSHGEARQIALGEVEIPEEFREFNVVDLSQIKDMETPGEHKRIRAGIGAVIGRSLGNVLIEWDSTKEKAPIRVYHDYDRTIEAKFRTYGSDFGSKRGASIHSSHTYHVSGTGNIDEQEPLYVGNDFLIGLFTDIEGNSTTIGKLAISRNPHDYDLPRINDEILGLHAGLGSLVSRCIVEDYFDDSSE